MQGDPILFFINHIYNIRQGAIQRSVKFLNFKKGFFIQISDHDLII